MKKDKKLSIDYKRIIYTFCMVLLCAVAFTRAAGNGDWWNLAVNCVGFCLFPVIVMRFGFKSFLKIPYGIWLLIATPVSIFVSIKFYYSAVHRMAFAALVFECLFYGLIVIRIIYGLIKKELTVSLKKISPLFYVCLAFFILASVSVNEALWPINLSIVFLSFYLSSDSKEDEETFFVSLSDALIIAFFAIQSFAFLHRPYDQTRYVGAYTNSNINGMFYYAVYLGWLSKYSYLRKNEKPKWIAVIHFLFASAMWSFALLTMSRSTLLAFVFTTVIFLVVSEIFIMRNKFWKGFLIKGVLMFAVFVLSFPLVFACVRYIPALRHHPVWITEYSEDFVHSYDPWNSEKYVEFNEFFDALVGRFDPENVDSRNTDITKEEVLIEERNASPKAYYFSTDKMVSSDMTAFLDSNISNTDAVLTADINASNTDVVLIADNNVLNTDAILLADNNDASEDVVSDETDELINGEIVDENGRVISYSDGIKPGSDEDHPAYTYEEYKGLEKIIGIRKYIFGYYFRDLNFFGHREEYPFAYILPWYNVPHAHNSYLQIAYCFGIPCGILYLGISLFAIVSPVVIAIIKKKETPWYMALVCTAQAGIFIIGLTENTALPGKMLFSLLFITLLPLMWQSGLNTPKLPDNKAMKKSDKSKGKN